MFNGEDKFLTVKEASLFTGKSVTVIYRKIKSGKLSVKTVLNNDKTVLNVRKLDLIKVFSIEDKTGFKQEDKTVLNTDKTVLTEDKFKSLMEEFFEEKQTSIMKPLEQQALYIAGKLEAENQFLKERLETVLQELDGLKETMKALPGPVAEVTEKIKTQEATIEELKKRIELEQQTINKANKLDAENTVIKARLDVALKEHNGLQEWLKTLPVPAGEIATRLEEKDRQIQEKEKEKELLQKKAEELEKGKVEIEQSHNTEIKELKKKLEQEQQEERDLLATINTLKARLEEEQKRPWWKKLF